MAAAAFSSSSLSLSIAHNGHCLHCLPGSSFQATDAWSMLNHFLELHVGHGNVVSSRGRTSHYCGLCDLKFGSTDDLASHSQDRHLRHVLYSSTLDVPHKGRSPPTPNIVGSSNGFEVKEDQCDNSLLQKSAKRSANHITLNEEESSLTREKKSRQSEVADVINSKSFSLEKDLDLGDTSDDEDEDEDIREPNEAENSHLIAEMKLAEANMRALEDPSFFPS
jgi:hypothetical protein